MSYKGFLDAQNDWLNRKSKNKNQLFQGLKPRDRIEKIIIEKIIPKIDNLNFKFRKSDLRIKRKDGDFEQSLKFIMNHKNYKNEIVSFEIILLVYSKKLETWRAENYSDKSLRLNGIIATNSAERLKDWNQQFERGWYKLHLDDNHKIVDEIINNIINVAVPYFSQYESYDQIIADFNKNPITNFIDLIDINLMLGKYQDAKLVLEQNRDFFEEKIIKEEKANSNSLFLRNEKPLYLSRKKKIENWVQHRV
ncbi:hypothetical protein [Psychroserpens mesophilus]|uniref:hypothetical protein n=1 Tax=Psychroserpens mesophilus TaxID=325473 RepID=UPI0005910E3C|nr:hypothetical protein [Psychroserpens mesophilus]